MKLSTLAKTVNGKLNGQDQEFFTVSTDTRKIKSGDLFIAIIGENFNGNKFIDAAAKKNAIAALVSENVSAKIPTIKVDDTLTAFGQLATAWRDQFSMPVAAITGSSGKTTTKNMLAAILKQKGNVLATIGTLNNDIGVPITLMGLTKQHDFAVIEMGANHFGEINYVTRLAKPDVAAITNAGAAHLEGFGDIAGVAKAKAEIFNGLSVDGIAVLNADDDYFAYWRDYNSVHKIISFAELAEADVQAKNIIINQQGCAEFDLVVDKESIKINLPILGKHNVYNALCAAACARGLGLRLVDIKNGLEAMPSESKRLNTKTGKNGVTIIDDTYNANPDSVKAALEILANYDGEKIFVFGQMGELGDNTQALHSEVGEVAKQLGINALYAYGELAENAVNAFGDNAKYFQDKDSLAKTLEASLNNHTTILVKGSRSMEMENIVAAIS